MAIHVVRASRSRRGIFEEGVRSTRHPSLIFLALQTSTVSDASVESQMLFRAVDCSMSLVPLY